MKGLFIVTIGQDEATGLYGAHTISVADGKHNDCSAKRLPTLMKTVSSRMAKRALHDRKFPPPVPSIIIAPNGHRAPKLIVPARN